MITGFSSCNMVWKVVGFYGKFINSHSLIFRKIPWINIYAEVNQEKEQEMIGTVGQNDTTPKIKLSEFSSPKELMEQDLEVCVKRK